VGFLHAGLGGIKLTPNLGALTSEAFQQSGFGLGQKVGHRDEVVAEGFSKLQGNGHIDANHRTTRREPKLAGDTQ